MSQPLFREEVVKIASAQRFLMWALLVVILVNFASFGLRIVVDEQAGGGDHAERQMAELVRLGDPGDQSDIDRSANLQCGSPLPRSGGRLGNRDLRSIANRPHASR